MAGSTRRRLTREVFEHRLAFDRNRDPGAVDLALLDDAVDELLDGRKIV